MGRYLTGLCVTALGVCAGGWLMLTPFAFGYPGRGRAAVTALGTGGALVVTCLAALTCWALLWRRRLRAEGVLTMRPTRRSRRSARRQTKAERLVRASRQRALVTAPDPAQVLTDLRALLTPLLTEASVEIVHATPAPAPAREPEPEPEPELEPVPVPGHLRGTRSASFLTAPRPRQAADPDPDPDSDEEPLKCTADPLLRGAGLLVVGSGEEEAW
jgi:hypothetical protein